MKTSDKNQKRSRNSKTLTAHSNWPSEDRLQQWVSQQHSTVYRTAISTLTGCAAINAATAVRGGAPSLVAVECLAVPATVLAAIPVVGVAAIATSDTEYTNGLTLKQNCDDNRMSFCGMWTMPTATV